MYYENFSALGVPMTVVSDGNAVTEIRRGSAPFDFPCAVTSEACRQLKEYFGGCRKEFGFPIDLEATPSATPFRVKVWHALREIPFGKTVTYGDLAEIVGCENGARAVGGAVGANPILIVIPCHRVVARDDIGGFSAGEDLKKLLLRHENIID